MASTPGWPWSDFLFCVVADGGVSRDEAGRDGGVGVPGPGLLAEMSSRQRESQRLKREGMGSGSVKSK